MFEARIKILDTTLREGEQTPGVYFPAHIKLKIARLLDQLGVYYIESGHPAVSASIFSSVQQLSRQGLRSIIAAHSRTMESDVDLALESGAQFLGIFYCVSSDRLNGVFNKSLSQAVEQIVKTISYAKEQRPELTVRYTPEDTVRSDYENVFAAAREAVKAGADIISVADTTGFVVPGIRSMYDFVKRLKDDLAESDCHPEIAVHCHNDRGFALANALDGIRAGATIVDASVLGLGERAGIVDLAQLATCLATEFGQKEELNLRTFADLYSLVARFAGFSAPPNFPIVGANAFTHCAGVHTNAATRNPFHYESLSPDLFGRERHFSLDHMSGKSSVQYALEKLGISPVESLVQFALTEVKKIGETGRMVSLEEFALIVDSHQA